MTLSVRTRTLLEYEGVRYEVTSHRPKFTADAVAVAAHVSPETFAKVVVMQGPGGRPLLAVLPASRHVDLEAFAELAGWGPVALAPEATCRRLFPDCETGAMPPFGNLYGVPVFVDECLARYPKVSFEGGTHREVVRMAYADFERLSRAVRGDFCR